LTKLTIKTGLKELSKNEVVEIVTGPEGEGKELRMKVATKDGIIGWVTLKSRPGVCYVATQNAARSWAASAGMASLVPADSGRVLRFRSIALVLSPCLLPVGRVVDPMPWIEGPEHMFLAENKTGRVKKDEDDEEHAPEVECSDKAESSERAESPRKGAAEPGEQA